MKWEDLELYERAPDRYLGRDKNGNEYAIREDLGGELYPVPKGTIWPTYFKATREEVMQLINRAKSKVA